MQLQSPGRMVLPRHVGASSMSFWSQHDSRVRASLQLNMSAQFRSSVYLRQDETLGDGTEHTVHVLLNTTSPGL